MRKKWVWRVTGAEIKVWDCLRWQDFYTDTPKTCPDYGRIINQRHFKRIMAMLEDSTVAVGGDNDESDCFIGGSQTLQKKNNWLWIWPQFSAKHKSPFWLTDCNCLTWCGSSSTDNPEGREARGEGDAGGDIRPSAAHLASERPGRSHQVHQQKREASGPLRLLAGQEGHLPMASCCSNCRLSRA